MWLFATRLAAMIFIVYLASTRRIRTGNARSLLHKSDTKLDEAATNGEGQGEVEGTPTAPLQEATSGEGHQEVEGTTTAPLQAVTIGTTTESLQDINWNANGWDQPQFTNGGRDVVLHETGWFGSSVADDAITAKGSRIGVKFKCDCQHTANGITDNVADWLTRVGSFNDWLSPSWFVAAIVCQPNCEADIYEMGARVKSGIAYTSLGSSFEMRISSGFNPRIEYLVEDRVVYTGAYAVDPRKVYHYAISWYGADAELKDIEFVDKVAFARVGSGHCLHGIRTHRGYQLLTASSLSDCETKCAQSQQCQAIMWTEQKQDLSLEILSGSHFCEFFNQTFTETDHSWYNQECWNRQSTNYQQLYSRNSFGRQITNFQCHDSGQIPAIQVWGCTGTCGPNWGDLTKCKSLCDFIVNCTHISYFSDGGCGLYSECSPIENFERGWNISAYTYAKVLEAPEIEVNFDDFDRVRVLENVTGKAHNRWTQEAENSSRLLQGDFGTITSGRWTRQAVLVLDKDVKNEVWVNYSYLVKDDPPLKEVDDDTDKLIQVVLKNFPQADDMAIFKCPITKQIFRVPVVASDGRTYENSSIQEASNGSEHVVPNYAINSLLKALTTKVEVKYQILVPGFGQVEVLKETEKLKYQILVKSPPALGAEMLNTLKCPLSLDFFRNPVVASDGHTYERNWILKVLHQNQDPVSPMTNEALSPKLSANRVMKSLLSALITQADNIQKEDSDLELSWNDSKASNI